MAIMFGNGTVEMLSEDTIKRTVVVRADDSGKLPDYFVADVYDSSSRGSARKKVFMGTGSIPAGMVNYSVSGLTIVALTKDDGTSITLTGGSGAFNPESDWATTVNGGQKVFVSYTAPAVTKTITISGDSFPGTYYVVGDTYARSDIDGSDQFFQFIIPKAKVTSENTITLEAEGDPSVFNMNLTVLRPESGEMMQLVQYDLSAAGD